MQSIKLPMMDHLVSQKKSPDQPILDASGEGDAHSKGKHFSDVLQTEQKQHAETDKQVKKKPVLPSGQPAVHKKPARPPEQPDKLTKNSEPDSAAAESPHEIDPLLDTSDPIPVAVDEENELATEMTDKKSTISMTWQMPLTMDITTAEVMSPPVFSMTDELDPVQIETLPSTLFESSPVEVELAQATQMTEASGVEIDTLSTALEEDGLVQHILHQLEESQTTAVPPDRQRLVDVSKSNQHEPPPAEIDLNEILTELVDTEVVELVPGLVVQEPAIETTSQVEDVLKESVQQAYFQESPLSSRQVVVDARLIHEQRLQQIHLKIAAYTEQMDGADAVNQDPIVDKSMEQLITFTVELIETLDVDPPPSTIESDSMLAVKAEVPPDIGAEIQLSPTLAVPEAADSQPNMLLSVETEMPLTPQLKLTTAAVVIPSEATDTDEVKTQPTSPPVVPDIYVDDPPIALTQKVSVIAAASSLLEEPKAKLNKVKTTAVDSGDQSDDVVQKEVNLVKENSLPKAVQIKEIQVADMKGVNLLPDDHSAAAEPKSSTTSASSSALYTPDKVMSMTMKLNHTQAQHVVSHQQMMQIVQDKFADMMRHHVMMMVDHGVKKAEIRLDPPELGSMKIKINMQGDQTQIQFQVAQVQTRDILEQSLPRLKEMLEQQGFSLADGHVNQESNHKENHEEGKNNDNFQDDSLLSMEDFETESDHLQQGIYKDGRVDFYA
ncbi:MAG: flagellar hook-length control protein FliK [Shewanellaceae bacterium]|nr:flagellar hook-length control protein FliK [Shewanellaceae bacterium]